MPSLKYTLEQIIIGFYESYLNTHRLVYSVEELHLIVQNTITVNTKSISNYLKHLKTMGFIEIIVGGGFKFTDLLLTHGKELYETKLNELIAPKEKTKEPETDDSGFFKY